MLITQETDFALYSNLLHAVARSINKHHVEQDKFGDSGILALRNLINVCDEECEPTGADSLTELQNVVGQFPPKDQANEFLKMLSRVYHRIEKKGIGGGAKLIKTSFQNKASNENKFYYSDI